MDLAVFPGGDLLRPSEGLSTGTFQLQRCNAIGNCSVVAGGSTLAQPTIGAPAVGNTLNRIDALATSPDGATYFASPGTFPNNAASDLSRHLAADRVNRGKCLRLPSALDRWRRILLFRR